MAMPASQIRPSGSSIRYRFSHRFTSGSAGSQTGRKLCSASSQTTKHCSICPPDARMRSTGNASSSSFARTKSRLPRLAPIIGLGPPGDGEVFAAQPLLGQLRMIGTRFHDGIPAAVAAIAAQALVDVSGQAAVARSPLDDRERVRRPASLCGLALNIDRDHLSHRAPHVRARIEIARLADFGAA